MSHAFQRVEACSICGQEAPSGRCPDGHVAGPLRPAAPDLRAVLTAQQIKIAAALGVTPERYATALLREKAAAPRLDPDTERIIENLWSRLRSPEPLRPPAPEPRKRKLTKTKKRRKYGPPPGYDCQAEPRRPYTPKQSARSDRRIALVSVLTPESRFLEQLNEAAHRRFLRILDRIPEERPEPLPEKGPRHA